MHKSYGWVIRVEALIVAKMPGQSVDECAAVIAATRMHDESCRLVDDEQDIILIDNVERNVLGNDFPVALRMVEDKRDDVASLYLVVALDGLVVRTDASCLGSFLNAIATRARHVIHEELIHTDRILAFVNFYAPMLEAILLPFAFIRRERIFQQLIVEQYVFLQLSHLSV